MRAKFNKLNHAEMHTLSHAFTSAPTAALHTIFAKADGASAPGDDGPPDWTVWTDALIRLSASFSPGLLKLTMERWWALGSFSADQRDTLIAFIDDPTTPPGAPGAPATTDEPPVPGPQPRRPSTGTAGGYASQPAQQDLAAGSALDDMFETVLRLARRHRCVE